MASVVSLGSNNQLNHLSQQISELAIVNKQMQQHFSSLETQLLKIDKHLQCVDRAIIDLDQRITNLEPKEKTAELIKHNLSPDNYLYTNYQHQPTEKIKQRAVLLIELYGPCHVMQMQISYVSQLDLLRAFFTKNILCPVVTVDDMEPFPINSPDCAFHSLELGTSILLPYNDGFYTRFINCDTETLFKI